MADLKAEGNQHFKIGEFDQALDCYTRAIEQLPNDHTLYSNRSGTWASLEIFDEALEDGLKCIELNPSFVKGYSRAGHAYLMQYEYMKAEEMYKKGLDIDPSNTACLEGVNNSQAKRHMPRANNMPGGSGDGVPFDKQGNMPGLDSMLKNPLMQKLMADKELQALIQKNPSLMMKVMNLMGDPSKIGDLMNDPDPDVRELMMKFMNFGDKNEAAMAETFESPEFKNPHKPEDYLPNLPKSQPKVAKSTPAAAAVSDSERLKMEGNAAYKARNFEEAIKKYQASFDADPKNLLVMNNMAAVYMEMGDLQQAKDTALKALDLRYEIKAEYEVVAKIYLRLGTIEEKMGNLEEAIEMYEKGLVEDNNRFLRNHLSEAKKKKTTKEKEAYYDNDKAEELRLKGNEFFKAGQFPDAVKQYDEALKRNPTDARIWSNNAAALMKILSLPDALIKINKAIELDPSFVKAHARKGDILTKMKEYNQAMDAYRKGLEVDSQNHDCEQGLNNVLRLIQQQSMGDAPDEETVARAMADPEIQQIMSDPQFRMILQQGESNPQAIQDAMKDPKFAKGFQRLLGAGILRMG